MDRYYKPSGKLTAGAAFTTIIIGVMATAVLSIAYAALIVYVPFVKLRILFPILFGAGLGAVIGGIAKKGKVRNPAFKYIVGGLMGLLATYVSWVAWIYFFGKEAGFGGVVVTDPLKIEAFMELLGKTGVWETRSGMSPKGLALYGIWLAEALTLIGGSALVAGLMFRATPFCETCERWLDDKISIGPLMPIDQLHAKQQAENGNVQPLIDLPVSEAADQAFTRLDVRACERCSMLYLLTVVAVAPAKKNEARGEKAFIENLLIDSDAYHQLMKKHTAAANPMASIATA